MTKKKKRPFRDHNWDNRNGTLLDFFSQLPGMVKMTKNIKKPSYIHINTLNHRMTGLLIFQKSIKCVSCVLHQKVTCVMCLKYGQNNAFMRQSIVRSL